MEGEAPAEPDEWDKGQGERDTEKDWAHREVRPPKMPNEFGAHLLCHQPLTEVSGTNAKRQRDTFKLPFSMSAMMLYRCPSGNLT